jgi:predicted N-formylglutamate amidohydrolase
MHRHGTPRGFAHALIEVSNDLQATAEDVAGRYDPIAGILEEAMSDSAVRLGCLG